MIAGKISNLPSALVDHILMISFADNEFDGLPDVQAFSIRGPTTWHPQVLRPVTHLERLWAYLSVKQLLDARELAQNKTRLEKEALALALKYSFVTPVSSLVVVKPNSTVRAVDTVPADKTLPLPLIAGGSFFSMKSYRKYLHLMF